MSSKAVTTSSSLGASPDGMTCLVCKRKHALRHCQSFLKQKLEVRLRLVLLHRYCSNCLAQTHTRKDCNSDYRCRVCNEQHHTLLHSRVIDRVQPWRAYHRFRNSSDGPRSSGSPKRAPPQHRGHNSSPKGRGRAGPRSSAHAATRSGRAGPRPSVHPDTRNGRDGPRSTGISASLLSGIAIQPTAIIKMKNGNNTLYVRALLDPTLPRSIIARGCVRRLGLPIESLGDARLCNVQLRAGMDLNISFDVVAQVQDRIPVITPSRKIDERISTMFDGIKLADPKFYEPRGVDFVLGIDVYQRVMRSGTLEGQYGRPLAQLTAFGYVITGVAQA